jgi:hypothetical protein
MGKLSKDQKGDHGPEKTGKKNIGKHSSSSTPTSGGGNSANSCISTGSGGSSTPNTPGYVPICGGSLRSSSCTSSKFRRSTSRSDLQSINSIDLSESSDRNEQNSSAETSSRYSTSHTGCDNDEMHCGQALDDEEEEADEESRSEQQAETPIATLQLPVLEAVSNPIYSMPTIAAPPENRSMLCAITEREDEDSCDMDTDCSGVNAYFNCYPELYSNLVSCGGSTSCAAASGGFGHVMRPTAANFLRFFSQERQRSQLIEMSMNILQPNNQVRESVYEGDVEVNTTSYYQLPHDYNAQSQSEPQKPNHIIVSLFDKFLLHWFL